jgi:YVTN family beta-propeller protein
MRGWIAAMAALAAAWGASAFAETPAYRLLAQVPGPDGGWDYVRVDAPLDRVLVTRGGSVMALDLKTGKLATGLAPGSRLHVALPVDGGAEMLVTDGGTDSVVIADARTGTELASVPVGKGPDAATFDPRSGLVLVMDHAGGEVSLVDPKARRPRGDIRIGGVLEEASVDGHGLAFVNVESADELAVVDIGARAVVRRIPLAPCHGPTGSAYDARDRLVIVACQGVTAFVDPDARRVVQTLPTGQGADGVVYDAARRLAFTPAGRDGTLSVIAVSRRGSRIVQTLAIQKGARTIALDARSGRLYLPSAQYVARAGRFSVVPGTFHLLVVGPARP